MYGLQCGSRFKKKIAVRDFEMFRAAQFERHKPCKVVISKGDPQTWIYRQISPVCRAAGRNVASIAGNLNLDFSLTYSLQTLREERSQRQYLLNDLQRGLQDEFDSKLVQQLQELRNEYDDMIKNVRAEVEGKSESRIRDLLTLSDRNAETAARLQEELEEWRKRYQSLQPDVDRLRKEVQCVSKNYFAFYGNSRKQFFQ